MTLLRLTLKFVYTLLIPQLNSTFLVSIHLFSFFLLFPQLRNKQRSSNCITCILSSAVFCHHLYFDIMYFDIIFGIKFFIVLLNFIPI